MLIANRTRERQNKKKLKSRPVYYGFLKKFVVLNITIYSTITTLLQHNTDKKVTVNTPFLFFMNGMKNRNVL